MAVARGALVPSGSPSRGAWICFRDHVVYSATALHLDPPGPRVCGSFGQWLMCQIWWHGSEARRLWLVRVGFIDAEVEGGPAVWRWRFWRSSWRALLIRIERQQWERKRTEAIARWGEGAG